MSSDARCVLITGATGKLGKVFAIGFAELGWDVVFTTRGGPAAEALSEGCVTAGASSVAQVVVDLAKPESAIHVADRLGATGYRPHVLINNARDTRYLRSEADGQMSRGNWEGELMLGVVAPYELTMALVRSSDTRLDNVINVASMYGITAPNLTLYEKPDSDSPVNYGVTKAALIHLTKELAVRLAARKIRVNAVSYGGVGGRVDEAFEMRYARLCPAGHMLDVADVFGPVKFLATADASGMTGHNLVVDGGWTIW